MQVSKRQQEWLEFWGDKPFPPVHFKFEVNTFADLSQVGVELAGFVDRARREVLDPILEAVSPDRRDDFDRRTAAGVPGMVTVELSHLPRGKKVDKVTALTDEVWDRLLDAVSEGQVQELSVSIFRLRLDGSRDDTREFVHLFVEDPGRDLFPGAAAQVGCSVSLGTYGSAVPRSAQQVFVELACDTMRAFDGRWGGIALDRLGSGFAFERAAMRSTLSDGLVTCDTYARGYLWGNLLSQRHVATLGGLDAVVRDAPFAVRRVLDADTATVYLQATDDVNTFDDEVLRTIRSYLAPLLPASLEVEHEYVGPPLRIAPLD